jgi:PST family polysaccharide transporter
MLQALDRAGALLAFMIFSATLTVSAFAIGLHWGVVGVAAGFAVARTTVLPVFTTIVSRAAEIRVLAFAGAVRPVLEVSAAMGALALALRLGLEHVGAPAGLRLAVVVLFGAAAYLALLVWREPALVREVWTLMRRRGR